MRALIVTNMWPSADRPALGSFVRDQVAALRALDGVEVDVFAFPPRGYLRATAALARSRGERAYDVVHAHFGLSAWPALAARGERRAVTLHGTDLRHPRSRALTAAALPLLDLVATVGDELSRELPRSARGRRTAVLPCGVAVDRFRPLARDDARARLGLPADERCVLFPADPARAGKRHDRALEVAGDVRVHALGAVDPELVPLWVNAADAVLVPSDAEGFGLAVLEALACDVPVLATPVGIHAEAIDGVAGALCAPYDAERWRAALAAVLDDPDPRVAGRASAERWSSQRMAEGVLAAWTELLRSDAEAPRTGAVRA